MKFISDTKCLLEALGGCCEDSRLAGRVHRLTSTWWFRSLWWGILAGAIALFCGQSSKFIYIDF